MITHPSIRRPRLNLLIVIASVSLLFACTPLLISAEIYKWVDENGVTHYSEKTPSGTEDGSSKGRVREVSDEIDRQGTFAEFNEVAPREPSQGKSNQEPGNVDVRIEMFAFELSKSDRQHIERQVRGMYQAYVRWFGWNPQPSQPITLKIFGTYELFEQYQIDTRGKFSTNRSHYSPRNREILMLGSKFADRTLRVLMHEVSHAVMDMQVRRSSNWFNEGLACLFEGFVSKRNKFQVSSGGGWRLTMQHKLREGSLRPVSDYLNIKDRQWGSESGRVENSYYMIAWSLMRFLSSSDQGLQALAVSLGMQRSYSERPGELVGILDSAYPGGIGRLDKDWRRWIKES